ncbi:MAG: bacillithiol system redox-active protein YtxJ [Gemmatimonadaceae bacterium]
MPIERIPPGYGDGAAALLQSTTPLLVFKHSTMCMTSTFAHHEVEAFAEEHPECRVVLVDVLVQRVLARAIGNEVGIPHASPQALLVVEGRVCWHASHGRITAPAIASALSYAAASHPA